MAKKVAHAKVVYDADDKDFQRSARRVKISMAGVSKAFANASKVAVGLGAAYLALSKQAMQTAEDLNDMAIKAGANVEALQKLRFVATQNGASAQDMDDALTRLTRRMSLFANDGSGPAAKAIKELGIRVTDTSGNLRASDDVFFEIAQKFDAMAGNAQKAGLASMFFGETAGPRLMATLESGAPVIKAAGDELARLGGVLDQEAVQKAAAANAEFRKLTDILKTQVTQALIAGSGEASNFASALESLIEITPPVLEALGKMVDIIASGAAAMVNFRKSFDALRAGMGLGESPLATSPDKVWDAPEDISTQPRMIDPKTGLPFEFRGGGRGEAGMPTEGFDEGEALQRQIAVYEAQIEAQKAAQKEKESLAKSHAGAIKKIEKDLAFSQIDTSEKMFDGLLKSFASGNAQILAGLKAAKSAQALVNAYAAASDALADPSVPFWGKMAAMGSVLAAGMNLVNNIKAVGSGGQSQSAPAGASAGGGAAVPPAGQSPGGTYVRVNMVGGNMFSGDSVRDLIGKINEAIEDGAIIKGITA